MSVGSTRVVDRGGRQMRSKSKRSERRWRGSVVMRLSVVTSGLIGATRREEREDVSGDGDQGRWWRKRQRGGEGAGDERNGRW